jgi:apolipoprotein N-acyltransferase
MFPSQNTQDAAPAGSGNPMEGATAPELEPQNGYICEPLRLTAIFAWTVLAAAAFHAAYGWTNASPLILLYLLALLQLARADKWRKAFYPGIAVGILIGAVRLNFFWTIFSGGAIALWFVYAFWIGLFVALAASCIRRFPAKWGWLAIPFLWTGLEYFRSELYFLRFSWLTPGYVFGSAPWQAPLHHLGMYGVGFGLMTIACAAACLWETSRLSFLAVLLLGSAAFHFWGVAEAKAPPPAAATSVRAAGAQMELVTENEVLLGLEELIRKQPDCDLLILSEYTFDGAVPERIKTWCRKHHRYLIVGGKDAGPKSSFYNTAFVVGPTGEIVFRQVKCVPIQFFKDGLSATEQKLWDSPWGKLGVCICYDLSYTRVTDQLVRLGAQALIVPTMDVADWGKQQHELHARVAPVRAAEYGIPIFRLASSGISQLTDCSGRVVATAGFPGQHEIIDGRLSLAAPGSLPLDRWLAPFATGVTGAVIIWLLTVRRSPIKLQ